MLLIPPTTGKLQLITSGAGDVEVHTSSMDTGGTPPVQTPIPKNLVSITTATTTDIVDPPTSPAIRNVKLVSIFNNHATVSQTLTIQHTDGTNVVVFEKFALPPGARCSWTEARGFQYGPVLETPKRLSGPTQLTASLVTQYTAPAGAIAKIKEILLANASATDRTASVHCVLTGNTAVNANLIIPAVNIPANSVVQFTMETILGSGDFVSAIASAATAINMTMSGSEIA